MWVLKMILKKVFKIPYLFQLAICHTTDGVVFIASAIFTLTWNDPVTRENKSDCCC